ncbi:hypothetical protein C8R46DRAFT_1217856 [Mycena filopes]|nr:hypothetical protein C8R46DRAFT_1217856 [Mycena filopes]
MSSASDRSSSSLANIKKIVGGPSRIRAERKAERQHQYAEEVLGNHAYDDFAKPYDFARPAIRDDDYGIPVWPEYDPEKWPSIYHHKCDIEWCGYPNYPITVVGHHHCGYRRCPGNFYVSPEKAAMISTKDAKFKRRKAREAEFQKTMDTVDRAYNKLLNSSGRSAMEGRRRPRVPSYSSVASAPTLLRFPRHRDDSQPSDDPDQCDAEFGDTSTFKGNSLHPNATSSLRGPARPLPAWGAELQRIEAKAQARRAVKARNAARTPGQRLASQPPRPELNAKWSVSPHPIPPDR